MIRIFQRIVCKRLIICFKYTLSHILQDVWFFTTLVKDCFSIKYEFINSSCFIHPKNNLWSQGAYTSSIPKVMLQCSNSGTT